MREWRRLTTLEFWTDATYAAEYRSRRSRGTRLPLTFDLGDRMMYILAIVAVGTTTALVDDFVE
jgi:hypothetical protein